MNKAFSEILEKLEELQNEKEIGSHKVIVKEAKEIVQEVAEEYNNGWIPCSERLPEKTGSYFTTTRIFFVPDNVDKVDNYIGVSITNFSEKFGWSAYEVFAWQPLPEPYKEKGE